MANMRSSTQTENLLGAQSRLTGPTPILWLTNLLFPHPLLGAAKALTVKCGASP